MSDKYATLAPFESGLCCAAERLVELIVSFGERNLPMGYQVRKIGGRLRLQRRNKDPHAEYRHAFTLYPEREIRFYDAKELAKDVKAGLIEEFADQIRLVKELTQAVNEGCGKLKV